MNTRLKGQVATALAVFAAALSYFGLLVGYGFSVADEGAVIEQIERLADGEQLYRDFHIGYMPGFYYMHALIMRAFGHSVVPIRCFLAIVNAASIAFVFLFASSVSKRIWVGLGAALVCLGTFPVHPGLFSMSNTPYPTWYNLVIWLAAMCVLIRFQARPGVARLVAVGFLAGLAFAFKPNVGLFQIAVVSLAVLSALPMRRHGESGPIAFTAAVWWLWWVGIVAGVVWVFSGGAGPREYAIFVAPALAAALLVARRALALPADPRMPHVLVAAVAVVGTFVAVNLPWLVYYYLELERPRFLQRVLFYNSGFEQSYFIGHEPVTTSLCVTLLIFAAARGLPRLLSARGLRPDLVLAAVLPVGLLSLFIATQVRSMPEGFYLAMNRPFELFVPGVTVAVHWIGIATWWRCITRSSTDPVSTYPFGVAVLGAVFLYLQMYPRADFAHWAGAMAASCCLAFVLAGSLADAWRGENPRTPYALGAASLAFVLCLFPAVRVGNVLGATLEPGILGRDFVGSTSAKMPVWMNVGAASWYADVNALTQFVRTQSDPDEKVFYFPALGTISFMADRRNPTRHVYFFPGWPGREVEAEVIASLRRQPPRLLVVGQYHQLFFAGAHRYYHVLGDYIERNYRPVARFGVFVVFEHAGETPVQGAPVRAPLSFEESAPDESVEQLRWGLASDAPRVRTAVLARAAGWSVKSYSSLLVAALHDPDERVRDAAVWAARTTNDPVMSCELLTGTLDRRFSPRGRTLAMRRGARFAGEDCLPEILQLLASEDRFVHNAGIIAINNLLSRVRSQSFWFGGHFGLDTPRALVDVDTLVMFKQIRHYIEAPDLNPVFRDLGIYLAARSTDSRADDLLRQASRDLQSPRDRVQALWELAERGHGQEVLDAALAHLGEEFVLAPRLVVLALAQTKNGDERLARFIKTSVGKPRVAALWLAAQVGGPATVAEASRVMGSPFAIERSAAAWAVGNRGDLRYADLLEKATNDPDPTAAEMATYGLEAMRARRQAAAAD